MDKRKDGVNQTTAAVYREKIVEMVKRIEDVWILKTIHKFIVGMTKEGS